MGKIKIQKKDVWIDMTPMSDVMTLLLCFFMLTSTFLQPEPIQVTTPSSVSEVKVPEKNVLNILVSPEGQIFVGTDNKNDMLAIMQSVTDKFGVSLNAAQIKKFKEESMVGVPVNKMPEYLNLEPEEMAKVIPLGEGRVRIMEIPITENDPAAQKQIWEINLPKEVIIGCILRQNQTLIPRGDTRILAGDILVLISGNEQEEIALLELKGGGSKWRG